MEPAKEGVSAARSIHDCEAERATLSFSAQSMMQGAPEKLKMMGGLMSAVWSKDLPTCWFDMESSGITWGQAVKLNKPYILAHLVSLYRMLD